MLGWLIAGLVAVGGYFFLKSDSAQRAQLASTHPAGALPPSGAPGIDQEVSAAMVALLNAYSAQGCNGLTQPIVQRFQLAVNHYAQAAGIHPLPCPYTDGVFDASTDAILKSLSSASIAECELSFSQGGAPMTSASPDPATATAPAPTAYFPTAAQSYGSTTTTQTASASQPLVYLAPSPTSTNDPRFSRL